MRTVGVLGGMGPEATIYFMQQVVSAVPARDDADHVPLLVDNNPQVPSRIKAIIEGTGEDPGPVLAHMAQRLVGAGAEALVMPCNTAHYYADQVSAAVDVPFLNMVALASAEAARIAPGGKVGLLGSPALQQVGVFEAALAEEGLTPVYAKETGRVLATIRSIKAQGPSEFAAHTLTDVAAQMADDGAEVICICCTEFSLLAKEIDAKVPVFDALDVLVGATVAFSKSDEHSSDLTNGEGELRAASAL
ncbi:aspartate/glutamate racemase family protein [Marivita hallyeonensis]|uniref:Aspartate racemase n=1 Tax=Marivita hallyeonensis TaxID=996342 RepID=A0A1M5U6S8_9RHOB|nr:amino acid racemase [Marivita hallyeonensis]SHH58765.1 aspartate racemase [Marivita hallyeonensis]